MKKLQNIIDRKQLKFKILKMRFFSFLTMIVINIISMSPSIFAQNSPCQNGIPHYAFEYQDLTTFPKLHTDMDFTVLIGYIALDTVIKNVDYFDFYQFMKRQTYNDTIKTIMKYYYNMVDYNPLLFKASMSYSDDVSIYPNEIERALIEKIAKVSLTPYLDRAILENKYILHIYVDDTVYYYNPAGRGASSEYYMINATIIDNIKGKVLPNIFSYVPVDINQPNKILTYPANSCVEFKYSPAWGFYQNHLKSV